MPLGKAVFHYNDWQEAYESWNNLDAKCVASVLPEA